jgi:hypothetical protein
MCTELKTFVFSVHSLASKQGETSSDALVRQNVARVKLVTMVFVLLTITRCEIESGKRTGRRKERRKRNRNK